MNVLISIFLLICCGFLCGDAYSSVVQNDFKIFLSDRLVGYDDKNNWLKESDFPRYYMGSRPAYKNQFFFRLCMMLVEMLDRF